MMDIWNWSYDGVDWKEPLWGKNLEWPDLIMMIDELLRFVGLVIEWFWFGIECFAFWILMWMWLNVDFDVNGLNESSYWVYSNMMKREVNAVTDLCIMSHDEE